MEKTYVMSGGYAPDVLIGSAFLQTDSSVIVANENLYRFLGVVYSVVLKDHIHPDQMQMFCDNLEKCGYAERVFLAKCRRYDGEYADVAISVSKKCIDGIEYISVDVYDTLLMSLEYKKNKLQNAVSEKYARLSENIFFMYEVDNGNIGLYKNGRRILSGKLDKVRKKIIDSGFVFADDISQFGQICTAIAEANGEGFYNIFSTAFSENIFKSTFVNFRTVENNSQTEYVVGMISPTGKRNIAELDPMTYLLNKRAITEYAKSTFENADPQNEKIALIIVDLDNFKKVNDTFGHLAGDKTIMNAARIMRDVVGGKGKVGRIGGDEFLIVLHGIESELEGMVPFLRSLRSHIQFCFQNRFDDISITCSVGVSRFPLDSTDYDDLFLLADYCLYRAKTRGRNRFVIYDENRYVSLKEIKTNGTLIKKTGYVSDSEKLGHLLSVIDRVNAAWKRQHKKESLISLMKEIPEFYDVDSVQYCSFKNEDIYYEVSGYEIKDLKVLRSMLDIYRDFFAHNTYIFIGKYMHFKHEYKELTEYMRKNMLYSAAMIRDMDDNGELKGVFVLFTHKRYKNWSNYDKRILPPLCGVLSGLTDKD